MSNKLLPSDKLKEAYPKINDMIDRIDNLVGQTDKLKEAYPKINDRIDNLVGQTDKLKEAYPKINDRIDNLVGQTGDSNTEIVDARYSSVKSKTFTVLKDRLDEAETDTQSLDTRTTDLENRLDTVEKTTITISDRIHHIANTIYGQVSVELSGVTRTNLVKSSNSGVKSTVSTRLKVVGKNLVRNGNGEEGLNYWYDTVNATGTWDTNEKAFKVVSAANANVVSDLFKISPSKQYTISAKVKSDGVNDSFVAVQWYDKAGNFISSTQGNKVTSTTYATSTNLATPPKNAVIAKISLFNVNAHTAYFKEVQLEEGTTATEYEPYKESVAYITLPEGVDGLHSLPNGVKDKVSDDGELIKRTKKRNDIHLQTAWSVDLELTNTIRFSKNISADATTLISRSGILQIGDVIFNFNDNTINKDEELFDIYDDIIYIRVNKSRLSTLDSAGLEAWLQAQGSSALIYQLQTPKYYELVGVEDLYTFDGETTVIIEPAIKFEAIADSNGQIAIPNPELPIDFIESVKEKIVDGDSISYIDASYSQVDDTTIGGLTYGKKYRIVYHYPAELTTGPIIEATYEINTAATIVGLLDVQRRLEKELGSVWVTLLPLADKELQMYAISTIPDTSTATTQELGDKINELINVWK